VIGVRSELALERFKTQMPVRFETAEENVWVMGAVVDIRDDGLAREITQVMVPASA
jgi:calcineurin-like phosphoesterase